MENCFDKESKIEVENMVKQVLDVYRERIIKLDWMQDATKVEAVKKINSMTVKVEMCIRDRNSAMMADILSQIRIISAALTGYLQKRMQQCSKIIFW